MDIDHVHFYVNDAERSRDWFIHKMSFQSVASGTGKYARTEVIKSGPVYFVLSSPLNSSGPVAEFLRIHPPGVADLALRVADVEAIINRAIDCQAKVCCPVQSESGAQGKLKWGAIAGWGCLRHTLLERSGLTPLLPQASGLRVEAPSMKDDGRSIKVEPDANASSFEIQVSVKDTGTDPQDSELSFAGIDHAVLNVAEQDLQPAVTWYQEVLGFQPSRTFEIQTDYSGLRSEVMVHPDGSAQLPINEPASSNSQIQEFLDVNQGPGIQHIALQTSDITQAIARLRQRGLSLLEVPGSYYTQLKQRLKAFQGSINWHAIETHQVLVDWQAQFPQAILLQTFTQPIFEQPTFFFELIERRHQAQGFGEGNFLALFEAIEREQVKRGSLL
jgi:4-hydroxyphenylpyruvate dioxygenase